ncbi:GGDEF domain-containing protein [Deinococcus radiotolerans]|uniref:GGDEF domain-containing protein n=1 Tax=Deinococcus radiotolerans TaxID=1309407 RepID=A0ABQ2FHB4_9DEIO|nr:GGDEF domain-containing protein [Deinococcus radiotolerans]GGK93219.1 GGDEF domain-containing protein [Deinococcus radiotolerans]
MQKPVPTTELPDQAPWLIRQRHMFTWLVWLGALACAAALGSQYPDVDPLDAWALPTLTLILVCLRVLLSRAVIITATAVQVTFMATAAYVLLALNHQFSVLTVTSMALMENTYWFAVIYVAAFLVYEPRQATRVAGLILALATLICAANLLLTVPQAARINLIGPCAQFLLVGGVLTLMQATLGVQRTQYQAARAAALTDPLTGVANRRAAEERLAHLTRTGETYTLVLFDLDHFKRVNDMHGHAMGDLVLRGVADITRRHLPDGSLMARWGGEEFLLILPEQRDKHLRPMLDQLRSDLRHHRYGTVNGVTACFGVATAATAEDPVRVVERADLAMYRVKQQGRNDVHLADLRRTQVT